MKLITILCTIISMLLPGTAGAGELSPRPQRELLILATYNEPVANVYEMMFIDTLGDIYSLDMIANGFDTCGEVYPLALDLPVKFRTGALTTDELSRLTELIAAVDADNESYYSESSDGAGMYRMFAFRSNISGEQEALTLMTSGDMLRENMDAAALTLQTWLREYLPPERFLPDELITYGTDMPLYIKLNADDERLELRRCADSAVVTLHSANGTQTDATLDREALAELKALLDAQGISAQDELTDTEFASADHALTDGTAPESPNVEYALIVDFGDRRLTVQSSERSDEIAAIDGFLREQAKEQPAIQHALG